MSQTKGIPSNNHSQLTIAFINNLKAFIKEKYELAVFQLVLTRVFDYSSVDTKCQYMHVDHLNCHLTTQIHSKMPS